MMVEAVTVVKPDRRNITRTSTHDNIMLSVLVSRYKEPDAMLRRLLDSLSMQESIDWGSVEVLVYNDGGGHVDLGTFDGLPFGVSHADLPHRGVCATRNALMDDASGEYLMFCDADDSFTSTLGLYRVVDAIENGHPDVIASPYDIEVDGGWKCDRRDTFHVHGKAFRAGFVMENGIRYPDMEFSGDMFFLWLAFNLTANVVRLRDSSYAWRMNPDSVTRRDGHHRLRTYGTMLRCYELLLEDLSSRGRPDLKNRLVGALFSMMYSHVNDDEFMDGPDDAIEAAIRAMAEFCRRNGSLYRGLPECARRAALRSSERVHKKVDGDASDVLEWVAGMEERCER